MCAYEELNISQPWTNSIVEHFDVHFDQSKELMVASPSRSDASSTRKSLEAERGPPAYDSAPTASIPASPSTPLIKVGLFSRIFCRGSRKSVNKQDLPSYREAELAAAWAKVGIDVNNRSHGPRPHCTPEELLGAMDGLFSAPTRP